MKQKKKILRMRNTFDAYVDLRNSLSDANKSGTLSIGLKILLFYLEFQASRWCSKVMFLVKNNFWSELNNEINSQYR